MTSRMPIARPNATSLRAEARLLITAGVMLLAIGFPTTIVLVARALGPGGFSPVLPIAVGLPPILLGYLACHFASARLEKARMLEEHRTR